MSEEFKEYLTNEVARVSEREKVTPDRAFLFWFATNILELTEDDAREAISLEGPNDKGIDLFWVDDDEGRVIVAQGKYSGELRYRAKISDVTALESSLLWLADPEALRRDGRPDLAQAAQDYLNAVREGCGVELWYVYTGPRCANVEKHAGMFNQNTDNLSRRRVERHYHLDLLVSTWEEFQGASKRIPQEVIATADGGTLGFEGRFGAALVATVQASEVVRLYDKYEDRLFDRNVRLFLGMRKGSVNAGIAETLSDQGQRANFWAYNNGITLICDSFEPTKGGIRVRNFSIVNGCQTTVSLAQALKKDDPEVCVLARFIAASSGIVDDVIRFTNSQNPIRTWDIASQDRTQRRLKKAFESLRKPYIYLTRRGTRPTTGLQKYREEGRLRQIPIDVMGQYAAAFRGRPVLAYKHKAFLFSLHHDEVFPPDVPVEEVLFQWICGEVCRTVVREAISKRNENEVRVLRKGATLFVLATMAKIAALRNGATYLKGMSERQISSVRGKKRLTKYAECALGLYLQGVLDQTGLEKEELPTLIRNPDFYNKVADRVQRAYEQWARSDRWLSDALPRLS